ncbi:MAG: bifunctional metallophosphatase/5'-nucleotidase [Armatimonadetes bacterium]|nr:bifunctional metallophosphatase/5'-nucleotidase [Armatimonadota bacterium]
MTERLHLLHTNDLHGHLDAERAAWLAAEKARLTPCLLLDSGDAVSCGNVDFRPGGEPIHDLMNQASYDAGALGNREFHFTAFGQGQKLRRARFPILAANLVRPVGYDRIGDATWFEPLPGVRVRVFGLIVPMITADMRVRVLSRARFEPPLEAAQRILAGSPATVNLCLSHCGLSRDRALAAALPLDVILGGHSHTPTAELVEGTWIYQNEAHGGTVTHLTLTLEDGRLAGVERNCLRWSEFAGSLPAPGPIARLARRAWRWYQTHQQR